MTYSIPSQGVLRVRRRGERAGEEHERLAEELEERERGEDDRDVEVVRRRGVRHERDRGREHGHGEGRGDAGDVFGVRVRVLTTSQMGAYFAERATWILRVPLSS